MKHNGWERCSSEVMVRRVYTLPSLHNFVPTNVLLLCITVHRGASARRFRERRSCFHTPHRTTSTNSRLSVSQHRHFLRLPCPLDGMRDRGLQASCKQHTADAPPLSSAPRRVRASPLDAQSMGPCLCSDSCCHADWRSVCTNRSICVCSQSCSTCLPKASRAHRRVIIARLEPLPVVLSYAPMPPSVPRCGWHAPLELQMLFLWLLGGAP